MSCCMYQAQRDYYNCLTDVRTTSQNPKSKIRNHNILLSMRNCSLGYINKDDTLLSPVEDCFLHRVSYMWVLKPLPKEFLPGINWFVTIFLKAEWCEEFALYFARDIVWGINSLIKMRTASLMFSLDSKYYIPTTESSALRWPFNNCHISDVTRATNVTTLLSRGNSSHIWVYTNRSREHTHREAAKRCTRRINPKYNYRSQQEPSTSGECR